MQEIDNRGRNLNNQTAEEPKEQVKKSSEIEQSNPEWNFAGFWIRLQAQLIDWQLILVSTLLIIYYLRTKVLDVATLISTSGIVLYITVFILPAWSYLYQIIFISKFGGTIGKLVSGIKVIYKDGKNLSFRQSAFRYTVGYFISGLLFGLGFLWIFKDKKRQSWHDQISGTYVIYYKISLQFIGTLIFISLFFINVFLIKGIIQSNKGNLQLQSEISTLSEEIREILEFKEAPATIEPQEDNLII